MSATATYLYCFVQTPRKPTFPKALKGMPYASPPRALSAGDGVWLIVSDAPLAHYEEAPIKKHLEDMKTVADFALGHEAVVEHFALADSLLPMKLFTLFRDDERALRYVEKERARIDGALARVGGKVEYGLRVSLDEKAMRAAALKDSKKAGPPDSGAAFLMRKKLLRDAASEAQDRARERAEEVFEALAALSADALKRPLGADPEGSRLLLDGAFLVPRKKEKSFAALAKKKGGEIEPLGYRTELTGPWPAYHFVQDGAR